MTPGPRNANIDSSQVDRESAKCAKDAHKASENE